MKAKKSLIITLFAAVMVFAFGATMVFAADATADWKFNNDKTLIVSSDGLQEFTTTKTWSESDGVVVIGVDQAKYGKIPAGVEALTARYYDLNGAKFATSATKELAQIYPNTFSKSDITYLKLTAPADVTKASGDKGYAFVKISDIVGKAGTWTAEVKAIDQTTNEEFASGSTEDTQVEVSLDAKWVGAIPEDYYVEGKVAAATITVNGAIITPANAMFFMDKVDPKAKASDTTVDYDGAEHTVVMTNVKGHTVKYSVLNEETGKYDDVDAIKVTKVGTVQAKATLYNAKGDKVYEHPLNVVVNAAGTPSFDFDKDGVVDDYEYAVEGTEFDAYSYVVAIAKEVKGDKDKTAANEAAVKANEETLKAYFKDYYDVKAEASKADPNTFKLTVEPKDLTDAEKSALKKKYEELMKTFGLTGDAIIKYDGVAYATLHTNASNLIPEIEFVDSPTAVTYKAKKLKKKSASFTVTAVASNGAAVSYKLINAPAKIKIDKATGTITLAKKLKKGKYNIKVKAYLPTEYNLYDGATGGHVYRQIFETQDIKIKVKK